jgi:hypothetical protein
MQLHAQFTLLKPLLASSPESKRGFSNQEDNAKSVYFDQE